MEFDTHEYVVICPSCELIVEGERFSVVLISCWNIFITVGDHVIISNVGGVVIFSSEIRIECDQFALLHTHIPESCTHHSERRIECTEMCLALPL